MNNSFDQSLNEINRRSPTDGGGGGRRTPTDGGGGGR